MMRIDPAAGIVAMAVRRLCDVPDGVDARPPQGQTR
ncbi:hypothetical protein ACVIHI_007491 [Bradyrhizobium sp. USDA 4524]|uniref:Uncharacterized protein n=1 Tax=Bradyrhizobium brasilense TaxID=1419277 RepID=A0A1G7GLF1_9BRAD|nr:hypothetical protein [Bradyrhizobium sp. USDA 4538]MCP1900157.1 hypothetical protein [Bradyrhizobium sp. USDA 4537]MCP1994188.1 hypothetical protein [Bradyrhizobium sp. USDA 4539]SDE88952.1 hypothetical protein SAMN05216337_103838 [Bradyrhizobium brasilense]